MGAPSRPAPPPPAPPPPPPPAPESVEPSADELAGQKDLALTRRRKAATPGLTLLDETGAAANSKNLVGE